MGNEYADHEGEPVEQKKLYRPTPPFLQKLTYGAQIYAMKSLVALPIWYRGWQEYLHPPPGGPTIIKYYDCRRSLPVR